MWCDGEMGAGKAAQKGYALLLRPTCLVTPTLTCVLHTLSDCRDAKRVEAWIQAVLVDRRYYADDGAQPQSVST